MEDIDVDNTTPERSEEFIDTVDWIFKAENLVVAFQLSKALLRNWAEQMFTPPSTTGIACALPISETAEGFLKELNMEISAVWITKVTKIHSSPPFTRG